MATSLHHPINVPIRVDALWSNGPVVTDALATPATNFSLLSNTVAASNIQPWLGDTVQRPDGEVYYLPAGFHIHWTLPKALTCGSTVYVFDYPVFNELIQQGVPWSLVQILRAKTGSLKTERTLADVTTLLNSLVATGSFVPLTPSAFTPVTDCSKPVPSTPPSDLISSDARVAVYSKVPALTWDPIFLQIYGPMIIRAAARMKMPIVPNRWLVVRSDGKGVQKAWVVESDRLTPPTVGEKPSDPAADGSTVGPAAVPADFGTNDKSAPTSAPAASTVLFQYLGRTSDASTWAENPDPCIMRFAPLTAVGHGLPEFAASYLDCQGVFGLHDATADASTAYTYSVYGWFSDPANDPASPAYAVSASAASTAADRISNLLWLLDTPDPSIDGSVFLGKVTAQASGCAIINANLDIDVAIGNTAGEALSAALSDSLTQSGTHVAASLGLNPETFFNAAQAGLLRNALDSDGPAAIESALHQQAFQAASGGVIWDIKARATAASGVSQAPPAQAPELTAEAALALNKLNDAQIVFDRVQNDLTSQRALLFTDWCRTLHLDTDASLAPVFPNQKTASNGPETIGDLALQVLNATAVAIDCAGMGDGDPAFMFPFRAAVALYGAHAAAATALQRMAPNGGCELVTKPAPRFWRPNDPVVLLSEAAPTVGVTGKLPPSLAPTPDGLPYKAIDKKTWLVCTSAAPGAATAPAYLNHNWSTGPDAVWTAARVAEPAPAAAGPSWRPLTLEWEAQFCAFPGAGRITPATTTQGPFSVSQYKTSFVSDSFVPDADGIELVAAPDVAATWDNEASYTGRAVLSSQAANTMRSRILRLAGLDPNDTPPATLDLSKLPALLGEGAAATMLTHAYGANLVTLSQALDGFHDRLLMLRRIPQLSIFDPNWAAPNSPAKQSDATWDGDSQSFFTQIGTQALASPEQDDRYHPIRAGRCELTGLSLVDAFGQRRCWVPARLNLAIAQTLPDETDTKVQNASPAFLLPPRLTQPSRLLFRWVAADGSGEVESNRHPATTPVCGWLALNLVDETILVFQADGVLLGWVPTDGDRTLVPLPGRPAKAITDPFLLQVVSQLQTTHANVFDDIATALVTIEPRAHRQFSARSVLISQPLALVRAALQLELLGAPAPHHGYEWLANIKVDANGLTADSVSTYSPLTADAGASPASSLVSPFPDRETCGFTHVNFPVRLGDVSMDDDGLVAYWPLTGAKLTGDYTLVDSSPEAQTGVEPTLPLSCDPSSPATQVLMLLDPRAPVHATTGILPVKAICIPPDMFADAVNRMELLLTVGPVLTPPDQLLIPIPTEVPGKWTWSELTSPQGPMTSIDLTGKIDDRAHLGPVPPVVRDGWLTMANIEGGN